MTLSPIIYSNVCTDVLWDKSRAHDHDEVVRQHPFSSGKPISDEEARPKKKRISRGRKSDYSDDESADADSIIEKDHSEMVIARWEKIEKMLRSPVSFIRQRARALAEQYAREEGFEWEADDGADE